MKKVNRVVFFFLLIVISMAAPAQQTIPVIRFGLIADIQYANADTRGTRFYRNSLKKLDDCIRDLNRQQVQFSLNLGDITDRNPEDLDPVLEVLKKSETKIYTTPGNHDYKGIRNNNVLYRKLDMPAEYYAFKKGNWRFIMLNTNEVAAYSNVTGTWKEKELDAMIRKIKAANGHNAEEYNGGISSKQLKWLQQQLQQAGKKGEQVLIFSHHPFGCADGLTALNDKEVITLVSKFSCVKALIAGHHHAGTFCEINNIPCIVAEGMIETADQNSYGLIELYADKLVLSGYGRMTSRTIRFKGK
ncbi:metallophosphoesterase [Niabella beijingensis]|uniref:metallophosphoesterase n=1 Tax=Niabella beijingensis TaxID=2872700 RepID=UPI001CC16488|nr:metallophosphoesterase [Niabella beijingensis]MBZ4189443.1 metallophosphoesterase [Niabella beijingensis]